MAIKKVVDIDIRSDSKEAEKSFKTIKKDIDSIGKSSDKNLSGENLKKVTAELKNTENAAKSTKNRLRELEDEMADIGDVNSPQFQKLAREAGGLKDKINNAKAAVKSMSADFPRLQIGTQAFSAMGGAAQGAMGASQLLGSENEDVAKGLQKLVAVQSILNAVNTVSNALSDETALGLKLRSTLGKIKVANDNKQIVSTGRLTVAQKGLTIATWLGNGAMTALNVVMSLNPIALVVLAIAALGAGVMFLWKPIKNLVSGFEGLTDKMGVFGKVVKYTLGFILLPFIIAIKGIMMALEALGLVENDAARANKARHAARLKQAEEQLAKEKELRAQRKKAYESEQSNYDELIALAEAEGKNVNELTKKKIQGSLKYQKEQLKEIQNHIKILEMARDNSKGMEVVYNKIIDSHKESLQEQEKSIKEAELSLKVLDIKVKMEGAARNKSFQAEKLTEERRIEDLRQSLIKDDLDRGTAIRRTKYKRDLEDLKANGKLSNEESVLLAEQLRRDLIAIAQAATPEKLAIKQKEVEIEKQSNEEIVVNATMTKEERIQLEKDVEEAKLSISAKGFQLVSDISALFAGRSEKAARAAFNIQKASSIAIATISTYQAAQSAYASQMIIATPDAPIRAAVAAGVAIASGLAQVASIAKTKFKGGGGASAPSIGGGGSGAIGGGSQAAQFNVVGSTGINQLAEGLGGQGSQPIQTYVVSGDVTTAQSLDRNRIDTATI